MSRRYWLMKTEPNVFSIEDLQKSPNQTTPWDGVRNYRARNFMRDEMSVGDGVLFYHSNINPSVVGTATVVREGYPDHTSWDPESKYHDPKSTPEAPRWFMVDVRFDSEFAEPLPLPFLREVPELDGMMLLRKGVRLSVQPVTADEWKTILKLGRKTRR